MVGCGRSSRNCFEPCGDKDIQHGNFAGLDRLHAGVDAGAVPRGRTTCVADRFRGCPGWGVDLDAAESLSGAALVRGIHFLAARKAGWAGSVPDREPGFPGRAWCLLAGDTAFMGDLDPDRISAFSGALATARSDPGVESNR